MNGSRIRKEKVADSKISGYVRTGPKSTEVSNKSTEISQHILNCLMTNSYITQKISIYCILNNAVSKYSTQIHK